MQISRIKMIAACGVVALGCSFLPAQESHNDAPAGIPLKTTYDVSSLKYTPEERKNIDMAVAYYRDCVQSHNTAIGTNFLAVLARISRRRITLATVFSQAATPRAFNSAVTRGEP